MSVVVEKETGARALPDIYDQRKTVSAYAAWCAGADGDLRTKSGAHRELAANLLIVPANQERTDK